MKNGKKGIINGNSLLEMVISDLSIWIRKGREKQQIEPLRVWPVHHIFRFLILGQNVERKCKSHKFLHCGQEKDCVIWATSFIQSCKNKEN